MTNIADEGEDELMLSWHYGPLWTEDGAFMAYVCIELGTAGARGLTDCEWIVPGTIDPALPEPAE